MPRGIHPWVGPCPARHWHRVDPGAVDTYVRRVMYTRWIDAWRWRWRRRQPDPVDTTERDGIRHVVAQDDGTDALATRLTCSMPCPG